MDRKALLGVLTSWVFNYNTVEATLLFSGVIVCLSAIMYAAIGSGIYYQSLKVGGRRCCPSSSFSPRRAAATASPRVAPHAPRRCAPLPALRPPQDLVTAAVLIVIPLSIAYFVACVITEVSIMWNESAAADAAARGGRKGAKAPASSIPLGPDGEPLVGRMNNQANPLFLSGSGGALGGSNADGTGAADAIASMDKPPPPELWSVFRGSFVDMQARVGVGEARPLTPTRSPAPLAPAPRDRRNSSASRRTTRRSSSGPQPPVTTPAPRSQALPVSSARSTPSRPWALAALPPGHVRESRAAPAFSARAVSIATARAAASLSWPCAAPAARAARRRPRAPATCSSLAAPWARPTRSAEHARAEG